MTKTTRNISFFVYLALVLGLVQLTSGQTQYWSTEFGLSNDWVSQVLQDQQGYIWVATQYGLNRFDGYAFTSFHYEADNEQSIGGNWVNAVTQDSSGQFWLSSFLAGISSFDPGTGLARRHAVFKDSFEVSNFQTIFCDQGENIWAGGRHGLFRKLKNDDQFTLVSDAHVRVIQEDAEGNKYLLTPTALLLYHARTQKFEQIIEFKYNKISTIFYDSNQLLWVFGDDQLFNITKEKTGWVSENFSLDNIPNGAYFYDTPIFEDSNNNLWLGGEHGITLIDADRSSAETRPYLSFYPKGSPIGNALSFFEDKHQNIWIGTSKGLLLESPFNNRFYDRSAFRLVDDIEAPREIVQIGNEVWFANHNGLFHVDIKQKNAKIEQVLFESIFALHFSSAKNLLYAGSLSGLHQIDLHDNSTRIVKRRGTKINELKGGVVWAIEEDNKGQLWLGSSGALQRLNVESGEIIHFDPKLTKGLHSAPSQYLLIDRKGSLWAASVSTGLYKLPDASSINRLEDASFIQFKYQVDDTNSISNNITLFLSEGVDGDIWVATDGGLNRIIKEGELIRRYTRQNGLIDDKVMGIAVAANGDVWGSTIGHGIFQLKQNSETFTFFNRKDGLVSNNFLLSSVHINEEGLILFGSDNEIQILDPQQIEEVKKPTVSCHFTKLIFTDESDSRRSSNISLINQSNIELPVDRKSFRIEFTPLNYYRTEKTQYDFLLEEVHSTWQSNGQQRIFSFTGLSPGTYTLWVRPFHTDLIFDQLKYALVIHIKSPWWATWWAYAMYLVVVLVMAYGIYHFQLNRQLEKEESRRLQEMDKLKNRLYTNLTHELRTPLTIILGMATNLMSITSNEINTKVRMIKRNGQNLLDVVNQILELSKVESGEVQVHWVHGDVIAYMRHIVESFKSYAESNQIGLHFLPEIEQLFMDFDEEKIQKIASNLFSNALKNTVAGDNVYLQIRKLGSNVELYFRDTGKGISKDHLPYIFDRFYQTKAKEGSTGIGLSLTKEFVGLLDGSIFVESVFGQGSTFTISLPIKKQADIPGASVIKNSQKPRATGFDQLPHLNHVHDESVPLILLIEDNDDVLFYLAEILKHGYRLAFARNGEEGAIAAIQSIPDIVVSDVMMPLKDGYELCAELKMNDYTSHIPIILLTAKADTESRIEGLEKGADAYLPKPFHEEELVVRIRKLLELRKHLQDRYQNEAYWEKKTLDLETAEDIFVKKVRSIVETNLGNSSFGIQELCIEMAISRVHLHRKLKALTDQSASHFIRRIRLQKAKILLIDSDLNISEIAYDVGFNDPAYFSRIYTEVFGKPPSAER